MKKCMQAKNGKNKVLENGKNLDSLGVFLTEQNLWLDDFIITTLVSPQLIF